MQMVNIFIDLPSTDQFYLCLKPLSVESIKR